MAPTPRRWYLNPFAVLAAFVIACGYFLFRPACMAIDAETVARFDPPIEERRETTFYGSPLFQQKNGTWFQCKPWLSRQFFF